MKSSIPDNPLPTPGIVKALGLSSFTVRAIKRSLGIKCRYVLPSVVRKFLRDNPGFMPTRVFHNNSCTCEACRSKRAAVSTSVVAAPAEDSTAQRVSANRRHSSLGRMVKNLRKARKLSTVYLAEQTGLSMSCIYKLEKSGEVSIEVVKQIGKLISSSQQEYMALIAQWIKEHVGDEISELQISAIDKDDDLALQIERFKTLISGLSPEDRGKILVALSDAKVINFLCRS